MHDCTTETKTSRKCTRVLPSLPESLATLHQSYLAVLQGLKGKGARKIFPSVPTRECHLPNAILAGMYPRRATVQLSSMFSLGGNKRSKIGDKRHSPLVRVMLGAQCLELCVPCIVLTLWLQLCADHTLQNLLASCVLICLALRVSLSLPFLSNGGGPVRCPRGRVVLPVATGFSGGIVHAQHYLGACTQEQHKNTGGESGFQESNLQERILSSLYERLPGHFTSA